ncbi:hypothetical protein BC835DRAFT_1419187 [Cytidiella melzeri]|nr:hypothetical protein BC835DRAFT_1419187 [Cytidiella melzeri]
MNGVSQWHSIRPWRPTLSLVVREITSVSATFVLSSPLGADSTTTEQSLASLGITNDDDDRDIEEHACSSGRRIQIVSDVLSKGLSVKVNGTPWQRVLMKIDDEADEAIIILFGLMPGRQYDVELGIVPNEKTLRSQITTEDASNMSDLDASQDISTDEVPEQPEQSFPTTLSTLATDPSSPQSTSSPADLDGPETPPSFSLEDRRLQLNHTLSLLNNEHTTLTSTLKTARRDAQKADAAVRAEIEALKRASERSAPAELRARQKARALQEAARQALAAAEQVQAHVQELEDALPVLLRRKEELEVQWQQVEQESKLTRARREEAEARENKRTEAKQAEIVALSGRLDRLTTRREKLDAPGGIINELEEKLRRLEEERERVENDPYGYSFEENVSEDYELVPTREDSIFSSQQPPSQAQTQPQTQQKRHSHPASLSRQPVQPIARPDPIQRPGRANLPLSRQGVVKLHPAHTHSQSVPSWRQTPPSANGSTSGSSSSLSPVPASISNLSSRAPAFEPRGLRSDLNPTSVPFEPRGGLLPVSGLQAKSRK